VISWYSFLPPSKYCSTYPILNFILHFFIKFNDKKKPSQTNSGRLTILTTTITQLHNNNLPLEKTIMPPIIAIYFKTHAANIY